MQNSATRAAFSGPVTPLLMRWNRISLAGQFVLAGSVVLLVGMILIGVWVTRQIEDGVIRNTAASTALYMDSLVDPLIQELAERDTVSPEVSEELDHLLENTALGRRVVSFKIWKEGGLIAYSSRKSIIGKTFDTTPNLRRAWAGEITAEFDTLEDDEDALERAAGLPLLEMYSPVRERRTGRIIAVAEFYETAQALRENLFWANLKSWIVVAVVTIAMLGQLSGIVFRGSRTIDRQNHAAQQRISELSRLLAQNEELRDRVERASRRTAEINEQYLRRIGADLHDGPAQLLALASLRLDALKAYIKDAPQRESGRSDIEVVRESLVDALAEIRHISTGLMLPELDDLSPVEVLRTAARAHERRTESAVKLNIESVPDKLERSIKICIYRFVQEALSNAFRHGRGTDQTLTCRTDGTTIEVEASDAGPGFVPDEKTQSERLGLRGLNERIESLGGALKVISAPGRGTRLILSLEI